MERFFYSYCCYFAIIEYFYFMETIFDHTPTASELLNLADGMTKEQYLADWMRSKNHSILDIVLLYESRKNEPIAKKYRDLIPDLYQQWQWGLDSVITPI